MTDITLSPCDDLAGGKSAHGLGGLMARVGEREQPFPLQLVRVRTDIAGNVARSIIEQCFGNPFDVPIEAVHIFPLPGDGALIDVRLTAGDVSVRAECRDRSAAERLFADARAQGHGAALVTQERADVHTLRITNIPPRTTVSVHLVMVEKLDLIDGRHRWRFPTTTAPRYTPGRAIGHSGAGTQPDTDRVPDASRLQPPLRLQGGTVLDLEVLVQGQVRHVRSSLHACQLELANGGLRIAPAGHATLDRDFVLELGYADVAQPAVRAWTDGAYTLAVVEPPQQCVAPSMPRDAVFLIDISGSMTGSKLSAAKRAVTAALHGLVAGDRFELIAFDDAVESFASALVPYDDATLARADRWVLGLQARGGTEVLAAIKHAFAGEQPAGRLRTVLLITDGQVTNEPELLQAVHDLRGRGVLFVVGIDTAVHASLLKRLARMGGGACDLCAPSDDIEAVIARVESRFGSPLMEEVRVVGEPLTRLPHTLYAGHGVSTLVAAASGGVTVEARTPGGVWRAQAVPQRVDLPMAALWAREQVQDLEDQLAWQPTRRAALEAEITRVALAHGIASSCTAFVAVERSLTVHGKPVEVVQPVELPLAWDESFRGHDAHSCPPRCARPDAIAPLAALPMEAPRRAPSHIVPPGMPRVGGLADRVRKLFAGAPTEPAADAAAAPKQGDAPRDDAADLARMQGADGSFGGDVARTAAALLALVLLGHTRQRGLRKRTVQKIAAWLAARATEPRARLALEALERRERGEPVSAQRAWCDIAPHTREGEIVARAVTVTATT